MSTGGDYLTPVYDLETVEKLIGLHEHHGSKAQRDITYLDLLSWARDPGGDHTWTKLHEFDADGWMARRGPLAPDSELGTVLWDLMRAIDKLSLIEQAVLALRVCEFTESEMAMLLRDEKGNPLTQQRLGRILMGRPKRDAQGETVREPSICADCKNADPSMDRCAHGAVIYVGGVARKLQRSMNRPEPPTDLLVRRVADLETQLRTARQALLGAA